MTEENQDVVECRNCNRIVAVEDNRCLDCGEMICVFCGCTENAACEGGCYWVRPGVCSECDIRNEFMTREELLTLHFMTCNQAREIMSAKNQDYAGGGSDPFGNFRGALFLGVEPEIGLLMRCMDKFKRIEAFVNTGTLAVKDEPVDDAIRDVINYMILLKGLVEERKSKTQIIE